MLHARRLLLLSILVLPVAVAAAGSGQGPSRVRPALAITSCGQSSDAFTLSLLSKRIRLEHTYDALLAVSGLRDVRTLVVVVGGSVKGLGEAGTDRDQEMARVNRLLAAARQAGIKIIGVHIGGEARRGTVSDPFISLVIPKVDQLVVTEAGNKDGLFTRTSRTRRIPLVIVAQPAEVARELKALGGPAPRPLP